MNKQRIVKELGKKYPSKAIICIPEEDPKEIVCEFEPTSDHPGWSNVMAIVGKSEPHYHIVSTETYQDTKGTLAVYVGGKKHILKVGEKLTIKPGLVHYVESEDGKDVWFLTYSEPGWTAEDHILV